jgi:hypothetical protein
MLQADRSRVRFPFRSLDFLIDLILPAAYDLGFDSVYNRNEDQEPSKGRPARKANNLTAICGPIV